MVKNCNLFDSVFAAINLIPHMTTQNVLVCFCGWCRERKRERERERSEKERLTVVIRAKNPLCPHDFFLNNFGAKGWRARLFSPQTQNRTGHWQNFGVSPILT